MYKIKWLLTHLSIGEIKVWEHKRTTNLPVITSKNIKSIFVADNRMFAASVNILPDEHMQ